MFANDPNLFFTNHKNIIHINHTNHKDIKYIFAVVNKELVNIKDWFIANKLSLNVEKLFFHNPVIKNDILFCLLKLSKYKEKNL